MSPTLDTPEAGDGPILELSPEQNPLGLPPNPLLPEDITPPENCGVPLNGPFVKDLEVFSGGDQGSLYDYSPAWKNSLVYNVLGIYIESYTAASVNSE